MADMHATHLAILLEDVLHEDVLHELDPDLVLELQPELGHLESEAEPKLATRAEQNVDPGPEIPD